MSVVRIAWYGPSLTRNMATTSTALVGSPWHARCVAVSPGVDNTPESLLDTAYTTFSASHRDIVPQVGDVFTFADHAYQRTLSGWTALTIQHAHTTTRTAARPLAYGISPLAPRGAHTLADHQAIAQRFARWIWDQGLFPILPHLYLPQFLDDFNDDERTLAIQIGQTWLTESVLVFQLNVPCSAGMAAERELATNLGRPLEMVPWDALDYPLPYTLAAS